MNDPKMPSLAMSETLIGFGSSGREAWQAAVVTKDPSKLERIIGLSSAANARDYIVELVSILFCRRSTEKTKAIASQMIQRDIGSMPSAVEGIQYIQNKLEKQLGLLSASNLSPFH